MKLDSKLSKTSLQYSRAFINSIETPALLMQTEPRQVVTANTQSCELFEKELSQIEGSRGGQVFDCFHSFTDAGCGKDVNCEDCKIKHAVIETFLSGKSHEGLQTILPVKKLHEIIPYVIQVSTQKVGDFALITIDKYQKKL